MVKKEEHVWQEGAARLLSSMLLNELSVQSDAFSMSVLIGASIWPPLKKARTSPKAAAAFPGHVDI